MAAATPPVTLPQQSSSRDRYTRRDGSEQCSPELAQSTQHAETPDTPSTSDGVGEEGRRRAPYLGSPNTARRECYSASDT